MTDDDLFFSPSTASKQANTMAMLSPPPEEELRQLSATKSKRNTFFSSLSPGTPAAQPLVDSSRVYLNMQDTDLANKVKRKRSSPVKLQATGALEREQSSGSSSTVPATPNPRVRKQTKHSTQTPTRSRSPADALVSGSASKSKKATAARTLSQAQAVDASPTRKRSGGRASSAVPMSPHAHKPNADYVPPSMLTVAATPAFRRRGSTPIPPYEPPAERFTPPREIQMPAAPSTTSPSKSRKRTTNAKPNSKDKGPVRASTPLPIKLEPPEIDLTVPPPPPSPSDDPILLIGTSRPVPSTPKKRGSSNGPTTAHTPSSLFNDVDDDVDMDIPQPDFAPSSSLFSDNIPPVFDFDNMGPDDGGAWSDSDDGHPSKPGEPGVVEGDGEFTGHFYQYRSPVRMHDPPSSATRVRIDQWGRPISPHPKLLIADGSISVDAVEELDEVEESPSAPRSRKVSPVLEYQEENSGCVDDNAAEPTAGPSGSRKSLTLSEIEEMKFGKTSLAQEIPDEQEAEVSQVPLEEDSVEAQEQSISASHDYVNDIGMTEVETTMETDDTPQEGSSRVDELVNEESLQDENVVRPRSRSPQGNNQTEFLRPATPPTLDLARDRSPFASAAKGLQRRSSQNFEMFNVRPRSPSVNPFTESPVPPKQAVELPLQAPVDNEGSEDGSDSDSVESDVSVVKIVSNDPKAAARVAAILKMHDYDMIERERRRQKAIEDKLRKIRRKSALESGVGKSYASPKNRRRSMGPPSLANVSVPDLMKEAELELRNTPSRSRATTPQVQIRTPAQSESPVPHTLTLPGPRDWLKADWKRLDSCFTDERYQIAVTKGFPIGTLADVDDVDDANVIERFVDEMGGYAVVEQFGPAWTLEKLSLRVQSLRKRQRLGQGAPPTPTLASRIASASPSGSMIMPNFTPTPLERISRLPFFRKPSLPPPETPTMFTKPKPPVPPFILGPNYNHLRDEVPATPTLAQTESVIFDPSEELSQNLSPSVSPNRSPQLEDPSFSDTEQPPPPASAVKRSLSYLTSWLRASAQKPRLVRKEAPRLPGLPPPPPDVLGKPRGPVNTPSKRAAEKAPHPKDLVELQHAPLPPEPSRIPKKKVEPKRLVNLHHLPTPQPKDIPKAVIPRRSSSGSVKDLIKSFEALDDESQRVMARAANKDLQRVRSMDSIGGKVKKSANAGPSKQPTWKP